ncbi:MAG TPA: hypothetical protein VJL78_02410 [Candidatus Nitrosocosmicus sp.]|nr:hypothetical protein [Candidatus Nitrosocosmicus sp.]
MENIQYPHRRYVVSSSLSVSKTGSSPPFLSREKYYLNDNALYQRQN